MIIEVQRIPEDGERLTGEDPAEILALEGDADFVTAGQARYDLRVQVVSGQLLARGTVGSDVVMRCGRCLKEFVFPACERRFEYATEVSKNTESVDLTADIREAILLALPSYPVCREGCKGLCSECGTNLNEQDCKCERLSPGGWGALGNLPDWKQ